MKPPKLSKRQIEAKQLMLQAASDTGNPVIIRLTTTLFASTMTIRQMEAVESIIDNMSRVPMRKV